MQALCRWEESAGTLQIGGECGPVRCSLQYLRERRHDRGDRRVRRGGRAWHTRRAERKEGTLVDQPGNAPLGPRPAATAAIRLDRHEKGQARVEGLARGVLHRSARM